LPRAATGETAPRTLAISITRDGRTYLDGNPIDTNGLRAGVRAAAAADPETRAVIAADGRTAHADVIKVIDLLRRESVTRFSLNVDPIELQP
jgi:biopolymer transport protein ExbD